jgi:hypothetical protein
MVSKYTIDIHKTVEPTMIHQYEVRTMFVWHNRTYFFLLSRTDNVRIAQQIKQWFAGYLRKSTLPMYFLAIPEGKIQRKVNYAMHHVRDKHILCVPPSAITERMWAVARGYNTQK